MTVPLPETLTISELAVLLVLMFFFARWGWRHGIDAVVLSGLFILTADLLSDELAKLVANIINFGYAFVTLLGMGQFSTQNLSAVLNGTSDILKPLVNQNNPQDVGFVVTAILVFVVIAYFAFQYAEKKVGGKDPFLESLFGFLGGGVLGYICVTFVLERLVRFPQTLIVEASDVPRVRIDANVIVVVVLVLIVFGYGRSKASKKK